MTDMTDREMLEYAAKAAGIERGADRFDGGISITDITGRHRSLPKWNPLDDDGDALRLAVKLRMVVDTDYNGGANAGNAAVDFGEPEYGYQEGQGKPDPYAATRRAVVRAAAEIGKGMK